MTAPVFIIGCQRSGSTMLGAMVGAHPDVVCVPEAQFIVDLMPGVDASRMVEHDRFLEALRRHWRFKAWGLDARRIELKSSGSSRFGPIIQAVVDAYAAMHGKSDHRVWVEQQPGHVRHVWRLLEHFPDARFVHVVRDGRAVAASLMGLAWGPNRIYGAAYFWLQRLAFGLAAERLLPPERVIRVRYEDVLADPRGELGRLADFMDIPYADSMLKPTGLKVPRHTHGDHALVVQGALSQERVAAWKDRLGPREIEVFEAITGDILPLLDYPLVSRACPRPPSLFERVTMIAADKAVAGINQVRFGARRIIHVEASLWRHDLQQFLRGER